MSMHLTLICHPASGKSCSPITARPAETLRACAAASPIRPSRLPNLAAFRLRLASAVCTSQSTPLDLAPNNVLPRQHALGDYHCDGASAPASCADRSLGSAAFSALLLSFWDLPQLACPF
ncbi:uncharacterized protein ASCRUDRAFT_152610 [Ascoidea rubescens DSM 1968]|uniref:Uncharacterized protein n=1 Tax=Ascoidea rubescens DSM 1968 TaxID=1344418 RepID=A0A1D2VH18_9ASCO|nr:hypothetical protein ASCRUDRAFT_152610 [Ascoidea rubescens DSM 1968]ODV60925.1 hypothetical protein ASCRUDRAFT_152610 [Ascoidea rubescens DSM 1968]